MYSKEEKVQNYSTLCLGAESEQELAKAKFNLQRYRPTPQQGTAMAAYMYMPAVL